ncbi:MAG: hypothetical protein H7Y38_17540 [Armatimonadetes bacterium]|nr:hypothetical protein [Armatimonadota bacterium]
MTDEERTRREWKRRRGLVSELYKPDKVRLVVVGEAPPPNRFFYFADSLFYRHLARAFAPFVGEAVAGDPTRFLATYRALGGWHTDVCREPERASKGGADEIGHCVEAFLRDWEVLPFAPESVVIVSPKRLYDKLPPVLQEQVTETVAPPGQWRAHREAFLRDMETYLRLYFGQDVLTAAAQSVDTDDAALDFEIVTACANGTDETEVSRLITGHPREAALRRAWDN